ncbi:MULTISPECIES: ABC transporter substrate-binding protein [unclassified Nostoc]|uniref:ABC transporter substrate-binding protein n=1 Tax=unclassified Nostoc TaxID=2593658 RepID=UPI0025D90C11|nr:ABC transporter substrate-binding protein [Nostoc sp. JL23]
MYSKLGPLAVIRKQGTLEKRLKAQGNSVTWHETGRSSVIAVPPKSPLKKFEDIKGQEVYFQKGSASHYFILRALQSIGLTIKDIKIRSMPTIEARGAFLEGKIPVWMTGDPHYAIAEKMG